jgi:hypothetical protein
VNTFRRICRFVHREVAYLLAGLTVIYCISGIAVNHIDSWNPSYRLGKETFQIEPVPLGSTPEVTSGVLAQLDLQEPIKNVWRSSPTSLRVILQNATIDVDLTTGQAVRSGTLERPVLLDMNYLHLNHGKGLWTWIADVFAACLLVLVLTGVFLPKGRQGLAGRGGVWLVLGLVVPVVYIAFQRYL